MSQRKKRAILWCDAEANCREMSTVGGVAGIVDKAAQAGIDTIIVDVKPLGGEVLYRSALAPRIGEVDGFVYPESFDLLRTMLDKGHERGLNVHAAVNVFSEGHRVWNRGPAYEHPDWQVVNYEAKWSVRFSGGANLVVESINPWHPPHDEPCLYCRTGEMVGINGSVSAISISGCQVVGRHVNSTVQLAVPKDGCILLIPEHMYKRNICVGEEVVFSSEPAFRLAQDSKTPSWGIFVNPAGPVQNYELAIMREVVSGYDVDGITLDRMRYPNMTADFSDESRRMFERYLGRRLSAWPDDVYRVGSAPWRPAIRGPLYKEWIMWRASNIGEFAKKAAGVIREARAGVEVGIYVGSWYDSYYDVGVNWGSRTFHAGLDWMTSDYNESGFAEAFDYICTGCYYPQATRDDARRANSPEGATVEAACDVSQRAVSGAAPVYASLYLHDYEKNPDMFRKSVRVACESTAGVMLFDLVYLDKYGWWTVLKDSLAGDSGG